MKTNTCFLILLGTSLHLLGCLDFFGKISSERIGVLSLATTFRYLHKGQLNLPRLASGMASALFALVWAERAIKQGNANYPSCFSLNAEVTAKPAYLAMGFEFTGDHDDSPMQLSGNSLKKFLMGALQK